MWSSRRQLCWLSWRGWSRKPSRSFLPTTRLLSCAAASTRCSSAAAAGRSRSCLLPPHASQGGHGAPAPSPGVHGALYPSVTAASRTVLPSSLPHSRRSFTSRYDAVLHLRTLHIHTYDATLTAAACSTMTTAACLPRGVLLSFSHLHLNVAVVLSPVLSVTEGNCPSRAAGTSRRRGSDLSRCGGRASSSL